MTRLQAVYFKKSRRATINSQMNATVTQKINQSKVVGYVIK